MKIAIHKEVTIEPTIRTELLSSMFEVPATSKLSVTLSGDLNLESQPWNIGLIVGPSGSGKTLLLNELFGPEERLEWGRGSVIDDFEKSLSMEDISRACQSVGFNTIPAYLRPFSVLSNGERFRVETARRLLSSRSLIRMDEFTSVVDRQVAQFACHSIQKFVRQGEKKLVVASCHYDILDWLQPDWILEPGNPCRFTWRSLHGRPPINAAVSRVQYSTWKLFAPFHYMSADLNKAARCYGLYVANTDIIDLDVQVHDVGVRTFPNGGNDNRAINSELRIPSGLSLRKRELDSEMVSHGENESSDSGENTSTESEICATVLSSSSEFENLSRGSNPNERLVRSRTTLVSPDPYRIASLCGVLYRPHPRVSDIYGFTRMVTLPDFQGLGLAFVLACKVASAYKALGKRLHSYPNHPAWIRSYQRSKDWIQIKTSGQFSPKRGESSTVSGFGGRRCAVFMYVGPAMNKEEAERLINVDTTE